MPMADWLGLRVTPEQQSIWEQECAGGMWRFVFRRGSVVGIFCAVLYCLEYAARVSRQSWGPCSVALMVIAGVGLITTAFMTEVGGVQSLHAPRLISLFGWAYLIIGVLMTTIAATGAAWIHQVLIKRLTFALFRLYAAAVSGGGLAACSGGVSAGGSW